MRLLGIVGLTFCAALLAACGGNGDKVNTSGPITPGQSSAPISSTTAVSSLSRSSNNSSMSSARSAISASSQGGSTDTSGNYSITVNTTAIKLDVYWDRTSTTQTVNVKFKGDGALVGFPLGEDIDPNITVETQNVTDSSADFVFRIAKDYRYDEITTYKRKLRFVSGSADGSTIVYRDVDVDIVQHDGLRLGSSPDTLRGVWGLPAQSSFFVDTAKLQWSVASDIPGINFEPASGVGPATVTVSYDYEKVSLATKSVKINVAASSGDKAATTLGLELVSPNLDYFPYDLRLAIPDFGGTQKTIRIPVVFQQSKAIKAEWTASLPDWLSAERTSGQTGVDELVIKTNPAKAPSEEGIFDGTIKLNVNVAGQPISEQIPIKLQYEKFRFQANRQSFAFSDYGTQEAHTGVIKLNSRDINSALVEQFDVDVSANQSWVVIDSENLSAVNFHLNTSSLPAGFHRAEISIAPKNAHLAVAEKVTIGYYKTHGALTTGLGATVPSIKMAVADKLGPWVYFSEDDVFNTEVKKFNLITQTVDATYSLGSSTGYVWGMVISDDGRYLYAYDGSRISMIDLTTDTIAKQFYGNGVGTRMNYVRVNGLAMLTQDRVAIDALTGAGITGNSAFNDAQMRGIGDFVVSTDVDRLILHKHRYSYLTNNVDSEVLFRVDMDDINTSVPFSTTSNKAVRYLGMSLDGETLAVIHTDSATYSTNNITLEVLGFDENALQTKPFKLFDRVLLKPQGLEYAFKVFVSNKQRYFVAGNYYDQPTDTLRYMVKNFDFNHNVVQTFTTKSKSSVWFLLSADQKILSYIDGKQIIYPNSAVAEENVVVTQLVQ